MRKRPETFKFRLSSDERRAIADLAAWLQRSQSDAVRLVVIEAAKQLTQADHLPVTTQHAENLKQDIREKYVTG